MIDNIGIDIVDNNRVNDKINDSFLEMVLTDKEYSLYLQKKGKKRLHFLCGRIAGKEAIIKAVNQYENPHFKEIEILNQKNGSPYAIFKNYSLLISISHEENYTIAEAILLK